MVDTQKDAVQVSRSISTMPTEIIIEVFATLHRSDLKSMRLMCHRFDELTHEFLFDKAVVSSANDNVGLFQSVLDNERFAKHVKILVFDIARFQDIDLAHYIQYLVQQIANDLNKRRHGPESIDIPDALKTSLEGSKWFKDPGRTRDREELLAAFHEDLNAGYTSYIRMRRGQELHIDSTFPQNVAAAFKRCPNVQQVEVQTAWEPCNGPVGDSMESLLPVYPSSGYSARCWRPLFLRPSYPVHGGLDHTLSLLWLLDALSHRPQVSHLSFGRGGIQHLDDNAALSYPDDMVASGLRTVAALSQNLTHLNLWITIQFRLTPALSESSLTAALQNARHLKCLQFGACGSAAYEHHHLCRLSLLPLFKDCVFPDLIALELSGMIAFVDEYLMFFRNLRALSSLTLSSIDLQARLGIPIPTTINRFHEGIRSSLNLTAYSIVSPWNVHTAGVSWRPFFGTEGMKLKVAYERYVLYNDVEPFFRLD